MPDKQTDGNIGIYIRLQRYVKVALSACFSFNVAINIAIDADSKNMMQFMFKKEAKASA